MGEKKRGLVSSIATLLVVISLLFMELNLAHGDERRFLGVRGAVPPPPPQHNPWKTPSPSVNPPLTPPASIPPPPSTTDPLSPPPPSTTDPLSPPPPSVPSV